MLFPWLIAACSGPSVLDQVPGPPIRPAARPGALALARPGIEVALTLPASSRPGGLAAPESFPPPEDFRFHESRAKADIYRTRLPVQDHLMPTSEAGTHAFGSSAPPGMVVTGPEGEVPFERMGRGAWAWGFDREYLYVGLPKGSPRPVRDEWRITFPKATAAENALSLSTSGLSPEDFARRTLTVGNESATGLYLPAPAEARFRLVVPERGRLSFDATLLPPALAGGETSDGATVRALVVADGRETVLGGVSARSAARVPGRFDLSVWAGREVELVLRTEPGRDATADHVLLASPVVYTPSEAPERIVLVFVDTLRPDHLGLYGYDRPTSPNLDRWATHARVYEQARTVAPWTLPSARAVLTGDQPERFFETEGLAEAVGRAGWHTEALVTNAFLSQPFDTHRGWDAFSFDHLLGADAVIERARGVIRQHDDRDLLLMVHLMEPHLPYEEPWRHQGRFAGERPASLEALTRNDLTKIGRSHPDFAAIRSYVVGRYDQNVRAADDALLALIDAAGPHATVVLFSDHGEELWEHGGFEHGHDFHEELLRVPLVIRSPYLPEGRDPAPVSLLDVAPTLREIAGVPPVDGLPGRSLVGLAFGDPGAAEAFAARPQAFGRPLYGPDGWGVLAEGRKWWDRGGQQVLYSLGADPEEQLDLAAGEPELARWPARLGEALERPVRLAWRVQLKTTPWPYDVELLISHPEGIAAVWPGYDPRGRAASVRPELVDGRARMRITADAASPEVLYLQPQGDPYDPRGLAITITGRQVQIGGVCDQGPFAAGAAHPRLCGVGDARFAASIDLAWVPEPSGTEVAGFHPDMIEQLQELEYVQ